MSPISIRQIPFLSTILSQHLSLRRFLPVPELLNITPNAGSNLNVNLSGAGDFAVNTNHLYVDTSTGRVGIENTSPATALDVSGVISIGGARTVYNAQALGGFTGSLFFGDGGQSLSHTTGSEGYNNTGIGIGALSAVTTGKLNNTANGYKTLSTPTQPGRQHRQWIQNPLLQHNRKLQHCQWFFIPLLQHNRNTKHCQWPLGKVGS